MKTAEEWVKEHPIGGVSLKANEIIELEQRALTHTKQIQLDAFKAGMKFAAKKTYEEAQSKSPMSMGVTAFMVTDLANNLTSIPKEYYEPT